MTLYIKEVAPDIKIAFLADPPIKICKKEDLANVVFSCNCLMRQCNDYYYLDHICVDNKTSPPPPSSDYKTLSFCFGNTFEYEPAIGISKEIHSSYNNELKEMFSTFYVRNLLVTIIAKYSDVEKDEKIGSSIVVEEILF